MTLPCNKGHRRLFFQCWCWWWRGVTGWQLTLSHHARVVSTTLPGNCDSDISTIMLAEHGGHFIILYDHTVQAWPGTI